MENATGDDSPVTLAGGRLLAQISTNIVALLREHYGRGPMKAKTYALDDIIVVVMRGSGFTALEQTHMDSGHPARVVAMREEFQAMMAERYKNTILQSGRTAGEPISADHDPYLARAASGACAGYARLASLCLNDRGALDGLLAAARLDPLTGCLNYAAIRGELEREIDRCARHGRGLSCCFIDLDRFKQINDAHGHPEGNRVLADIAAVLRAGIRSGDSVGRYGGDVFIVLLPDTNRAAARALAARLRARIGGCTLNHGHEPVDASVGVAQWRIGTTADELIVAADEALRAAKRAGGGTVVTAGGVAARTGRVAAGVRV